MTTEILQTETPTESQELPGVLLTMGDVQQKVHSLTNTEWNQVRMENPQLFVLQKMKGKKMTFGISDSRLGEFKEMLRGLRNRKAKDRIRRNSPEILAEREKEYLQRKLFKPRFSNY